MQRIRILVWDLPVRLFHWLLALSFAGAFLTAESERVRDLHVAFGYTFMALLAFRLVWGLIGTRHARFASFAYGPKAVLAYVRSLPTRTPLHFVGHNPAGSWAIFAMLALGIAIGVSGYVLYEDAGGRWTESLHEGAANAMLALVVVHVAAVLVSSLLHRENLVAAMVTGRKRGAASEGIGRSRFAAATAAVVAFAVAALWGAAYGLPDAAPESATSVPAGNGVHDARVKHRDRGDDS